MEQIPYLRVYGIAFDRREGIFWTLGDGTKRALLALGLGTRRQLLTRPFRRKGFLLQGHSAESRKGLEARQENDKGLVRKRRCVSHVLAATREATVVHVIYTVMK